jgi:hypothetical protein
MILNIFYPQASQTTPSATQQYPLCAEPLLKIRLPVILTDICASSQANWGTAGEKAIVAFGVFLDNETMLAMF